MSSIGKSNYHVLRVKRSNLAFSETCERICLNCVEYSDDSDCGELEVVKLIYEDHSDNDVAELFERDEVESCGVRNDECGGYDEVDLVHPFGGGTDGELYDQDEISSCEEIEPDVFQNVDVALYPSAGNFRNNYERDLNAENVGFFTDDTYFEDSYNLQLFEDQEEQLEDTQFDLELDQHCHVLSGILPHGLSVEESGVRFHEEQLEHSSQGNADQCLPLEDDLFSSCSLTSISSVGPSSSGSSFTSSSLGTSSPSSVYSSSSSLSPTSNDSDVYDEVDNPRAKELFYKKRRSMPIITVPSCEENTNGGSSIKQIFATQQTNSSLLPISPKSKRNFLTSKLYSKSLYNLLPTKK